MNRNQWIRKSISVLLAVLLISAMPLGAFAADDDWNAADYMGLSFYGFVTGYEGEEHDAQLANYYPVTTHIADDAGRSVTILGTQVTNSSLAGNQLADMTIRGGMVEAFVKPGTYSIKMYEGSGKQSPLQTSLSYQDTYFYASNLKSSDNVTFSATDTEINAFAIGSDRNDRRDSSFQMDLYYYTPEGPLKNGIELTVTMYRDQISVTKVEGGVILRGAESCIVNVEHPAGSAAYYLNGSGVSVELNGRTAFVDEITGEISFFSYDDVETDDWYFDAVYGLRDAGIMYGTNETMFSPLAGMSRAMLVVVLYRLAGENVNYTASFSDVPQDSYYARAVAWAAGMGIVNGSGQGSFHPRSGVTREQTVTILMRYLEQTDFTLSGGSSVDLSSYRDGDRVSPYARDAVRWAVSSGLLSTNDGNLNPRGEITRAEVAVMLQWLLDMPTEQ